MSTRAEKIETVLRHLIAEADETGGHTRTVSRATVDEARRLLAIPADTPDEDPDEPSVLVFGNLHDGFRFVGPFPDFDSASEYDTGGGAWVATLTPPKVIQYGPENCPGRPCADGCDHRGFLTPGKIR